MTQTNKPKLMWLVRSAVRALHYSYETEKVYVYWIKSFIHYFNLRHPKDMAAKEVTQYLSHLAVDKHVAPSTQNQALCALVFLYKRVLKMPLGENEISAVRPKYHKNFACSTFKG